MTHEQKDGTGSRVLSTAVLDIAGRVMWFLRVPGAATAQDWKQLTITRERMVIDGAQVIELADIAEIKIWLHEARPHKNTLPTERQQECRSA